MAFDREEIASLESFFFLVVKNMAEKKPSFCTYKELFQIILIEETGEASLNCFIS